MESRGDAAIAAREKGPPHLPPGRGLPGPACQPPVRASTSAQRRSNVS
jgi:hypothetical protein